MDPGEGRGIDERLIQVFEKWVNLKIKKLRREFIRRQDPQILEFALTDAGDRLLRSHRQGVLGQSSMFQIDARSWLYNRPNQMTDRRRQNSVYGSNPLYGAF